MASTLLLMLSMFLGVMFACSSMRTSMSGTGGSVQRQDGPAGLDLSNWMGQLGPILKDATLLDISLPGTHDTMTYDLSDTLSDGYEGFDSFLSWILHTITPAIAGRFIRAQGQTQGIDIAQMLDGGMRFVDFRIMRSQPPDKAIAGKDWYCLHGCETRNKAITYLQTIRKWMDEHPKEIVVLWASRHGDSSLTGTKQYPDTTPSERQDFFKQVQATFGPMLFDSTSGRLNETSIATLQEQGMRLVWYAADYVESTNSSAFALDAMVELDNNLPGAGPELGVLNFLRKGAGLMADRKANNKFLLVSMASGCPSKQIKYAALIKYLGWWRKQHMIEQCAQEFGIPNMTTWCPAALMDCALQSNYYNQRVLDTLYQEGATNTDVSFPNAIYIDAVDVGGLIRTGTDLINPLENSLLRPPEEHGTSGYAYAATVIGSNVQRLCRAAGGPSCAQATEMINAARDAHKVQLWTDTYHGRLENWPVIPPPST